MCGVDVCGVRVSVWFGVCVCVGMWLDVELGVCVCVWCGYVWCVDVCLWEWMCFCVCLLVCGYGRVGEYVWVCVGVLCGWVGGCV